MFNLPGHFFYCFIVKDSQARNQVVFKVFFQVVMFSIETVPRVQHQPRLGDDDSWEHRCQYCRKCFLVGFIDGGGNGVHGGDGRRDLVSFGNSMDVALKTAADTSLSLFLVSSLSLLA